MKIAALPIHENLRQRLIEVVCNNLDVFAGSATDLGRTSVVVHTIKNRESKDFRHKLHPILFARRHYLENEVERLITVCALSSKNKGACPYASRTDIALQEAACECVWTTATWMHRQKKIHFPSQELIKHGQ